ncbi:hypothetical protein RPALISO_234 [Ruegeria phage RpAliso]|nr:hypothetical protein RPALISO_234 [Ruegeria phage RpAliso]
MNRYNVQITKSVYSEDAETAAKDALQYIAAGNADSYVEVFPDGDNMTEWEGNLDVEPATDSEGEGPEGDTPFSFPEIGLWLNERDYMRASDLITEAARLAGDGAAGDLGRNPEYERGMAELIMRAMGWPCDHVGEIIACIHATAKDNAKG